VPLIGIFVFCGYYSYSRWSEADKVLVFIQAVAMAFPLIISIATSMLYEQELKAGNFQNVLSVPYQKVVSHSGNLITLCLFGLFASIFTILGFGMIFRIMGYAIFSIPIYFKLSLVMFLSNVTLYILQYIICFTFGNGISLSIGIIGTLLSPLLYLGLGDIIWRYIPCGYAIRISTYYFKQYSDINLYNAIVQDLKTGTMTVSIITVILICFFVIWSNHWQGKSVKFE
jgi:lantibiotic protection ABC transporter permease subunit, MutG family